MMTLIKARWNARSVPGRIGNHSDDFAAVLVKRGSSVITFAPSVDSLAQGGGLRSGNGFHQIAPGQDDVFQVIIFSGGFFHAVGCEIGD